MEVIGVASGREPSVTRPPGSASVFLTLRGSRDSKVRDRDTKLNLTLGAAQAAQLWRLLGEVLTDAEKGDSPTTA